MKTTKARLVFGLFFGCAAVSAFAESEVSWNNERLTVHAQDVSRAQLIRQISEKTNIRVTGLENVSGQVSIDVDSVPFEAALPKLAGAVGYTLVEFLPDSVSRMRRRELNFIAGRKSVGLKDMRGKDAPPPGATVIAEDGSVIDTGTENSSTPSDFQPDIQRPEQRKGPPLPGFAVSEE
jgi:hypothetical protein